MRLFSRISLILLAVLFAWRLGPAFISGLVYIFPAFGSFVKWLFPSVQGRSAMEWFEFIVAIFLFWFLFKAAGIALGFMVPQAQLFGTTKLLRRFQGVCGEGFIIFGLFMGVTLVDAMFRNAPQSHQSNPGQFSPNGPIDVNPLKPDNSDDKDKKRGSKESPLLKKF